MSEEAVPGIRTDLRTKIEMQKSLKVNKIQERIADIIVFDSILGLVSAFG